MQSINVSLDLFFCFIMNCFDVVPSIPDNNFDSGTSQSQALDFWLHGTFELLCPMRGVPSSWTRPALSVMRPFFEILRASWIAWLWLWLLASLMATLPPRHLVSVSLHLVYLNQSLRTLFQLILGMKQLLNPSSMITADLNVNVCKFLLKVVILGGMHGLEFGSLFLFYMPSRGQIHL